MTPPTYREYLGDSVYAEIGFGMLKLYTDYNGLVPDQVIYLDRDVILALGDYVKRFLEPAEAQKIVKAFGRFTRKF